MNSPITQHYVPQFLLRNFKIQSYTGKESAIYTYDKVRNTSYQSTIKKTAAENYFYEARNENYSIEQELATYESLVSPIIAKILKNQSLKKLTKKEKKVLTRFICIQLMRGPAQREFISSLGIVLEQMNFFENINIEKPTKEDDKIAHCKWILNALHDFFHVIYNKDWTLQDAGSNELILGDNPIVLHRTFDDEYNVIKLGVGIPGVEIYFPISPRYCLMLVCKSVRKKLAPTKNDIHNSCPIIKEKLKIMKSYADKLRLNSTMTLDNKSIIFLNKLQYDSSTRFIYSSKLIEIELLKNTSCI